MSSGLGFGILALALVLVAIALALVLVLVLGVESAFATGLDPCVGGISFPRSGLSCRREGTLNFFGLKMFILNIAPRWRHNRGGLETVGRPTGYVPRIAYPTRTAWAGPSPI